MPNTKIATIWNTYGPYHLSRVLALRRIFTQADIICFSQCASNLTHYPFFNLQPDNHEVIVQKDNRHCNFAGSFFATYRKLRHHSPRLILTCGYERPESLASILYSKATHAKVFLMLDNNFNDHHRRQSVELVKRFYLRHFDGFLYGGDAKANYLGRLGVPERKVRNGYNCVDNDSIAGLTDAFRSERPHDIEPCDYFLCVARLIPKKNISTILEAYRQYMVDLPHNFAPWELVICGDGPLRMQLQAQSKALDIQRAVRFIGRVDDFEKLIQHYALARAAILASRADEQWGLVVNEAMAAGLPVLVSRQCGCASSLVEDGVNGFTFEAMSATDLANRMIWLHRNEEKLRTMGAESRRIVDRFSPTHFAEGVLDLYERAIS